MYSICGKTLAVALAALWVVFTPTQPVPPTTTSHPTLLHPPAVHVSLWSQPEEPTSIELRVPEGLVNTLHTQERASEALDLCVPEILLERLYGAGHVSGLEKSPAP